MLFFFTVSHAQQLTGVVIDKQTGDSIPFASLIYKGNHVSVAGEADGTFSIERHNGWSLTVKAVGYKTEKISIRQSTPSHIVGGLFGSANRRQ